MKVFPDRDAELLSTLSTNSKSNKAESGSTFKYFIQQVHSWNRSAKTGGFCLHMVAETPVGLKLNMPTQRSSENGKYSQSVCPDPR